MLERPQLRLRTWTAAPARLTLADADSDAPLGFACWRRRKGWLNWVTRPALEVRETEDEPLLMTLYRGWGWRTNWEVCDADNMLVGYVHGALLLSEFGDELGRWRWTDRPDRALIVQPRAGVLARAERHNDNVLLVFDPLTHSPFARMVLLAATLAHMRL